MSEIFAPGSVAGPAGPAGAAGSLANVKSLIDNLLPNIGNLFDYTRVVTGLVNSDGTVTATAGFQASPLIYCAGATAAISNLPAYASSSSSYCIALYDANANFLETIDGAYIGPAFNSGPGILTPGVFPLPGTQTYVRLCWYTGNVGSGPYPSLNAASFYAGTTANPPSIPGTYQPFGFDSVADVNTKVAAAIVTVQSSLGPMVAGAATSLAGSTLPSFVGRNLFEISKVTTGYVVQGSNGSIAASGAANATAPIFCPGATSMVSNLPIDIGAIAAGDGVCLYDASGNFMSVLSSGAYSSTTVGGGAVSHAAAFALPGTQTYVRFGYVPSWFNGYDSDQWPEASHALGMVYATITGTATLPGGFQAGGLDTAADVNAKDAVVAANAASALAALPATLFKVALPGPLANLRNGFDYTKAVFGMQTDSDGTWSASGGTYVGRAYCPGATSAISNIPIYVSADGNLTLNTFDASGNFLADISSTISAGLQTSSRITGNTVFPLPGNQAYVEFTFPPSWGSVWANSLLSCVFFSGTTSAPPPTNFSATPLLPFEGNPSPFVRTATSLGAVPDGYADAAGVLNAFLATASSSNPVELILDGMFNVAGLVISANGHTTIRGLGAGTGINISGPQDGIRIGAYSSATVPNGDSEGEYSSTLPARSAVNICLRDFAVNAAGQASAAANQPFSGDLAHSTYGVILTSCSNVMIDNLYFPTYCVAYCICLSNVDNVRVTNCNFNTTGYVHDGVHIDGPANDIGITNCKFTTGDDAIALNAPEGYGGDISRVTVTNCQFINSLSVMRIYTSLDLAAMPSNNVHKVRDVVISNCTGHISNICFVLGIEGDSLTSTSDVDQIQDFSVSNCTLSCPTNLLNLRDSVGAITMNSVKFSPASTNAVFDLGSGNVGELSLTDFTILRNPDGNAAADVVYTGGTVDKLSLVHCRVTDEEGTSYTPMSSWVNNGGTVSNLRLEAVDMTHVAALTAGSSWTGFTTVKGSGVLGTGVQVPDTAMDNNALYLSSTASGAPSIKVAGTAKRLTLA